MTKQFGGKVTADLTSIYSQSPNWKGKSFENLVETKMDMSFQSIPKLLYEQFCKKEGRTPKQKLPITPFDSEAFLEASDSVKFIWFGHAVVLLRINGKTLLIDPMFGPDASPIAPFATKRFSDNTLDIIDELPEIDLMLLTHDHYDHLDLASLQKLKPKVKEYYVSLGSARHLLKWDIPTEQITEFDWWDERNFEGIQITFTPTRHFAGRGLTDRNKTLWGGWTFKTDNENIYFSGDGGYGDHFKEVGERLGPFDFAFMECGQYHENWHQIHMYPEESVQAAQDVNARLIMPFHWASFALALHTWTDPVERFSASAQEANIPILTPRLGEIVDLSKGGFSEKWWEDYE